MGDHTQRTVYAVTSFGIRSYLGTFRKGYYLPMPGESDPEGRVFESWSEARDRLITNLAHELAESEAVTHSCREALRHAKSMTDPTIA